uniref:26S proteasome non-ATPase regulatory subunit 13 n=2 Tax=Parascaris univalens TaxID=6257 RepID=A0A914ZN95_PARUN
AQRTLVASGRSLILEMAEKVERYLAKKKASATSDIADIWQKLEQLYTKKLWHQLTVELRGVIYQESFTKSIDLKDFYENFIKEFEHRINPLQLVEIVMPVAKSIFIKNKESAYEFLSKIEKTVSKDKQAVVRVWTGQIELRLLHKDKAERCVDIQLIRQMVEDTQAKLDDLPGVTPVHAPFYKVSAVYLKEIGNYAGYYREALRYLGCEDQSKLSQSEKQMQAVLLGFAALLGENIYNFGELLAHPILKALEGTHEKWLVDVLFAFNAGDLNRFKRYKPQWSEWDDIKKHTDFLEDKIRLLCLMEIALARPSKERYITFNEIAKRAQIDKSKVEFLVMKALSKGLVQGSIDQVNQLINITWVQPRVLSPQQILAMSERIGTWGKDVDSMETIVKDNARDILTKA